MKELELLLDSCRSNFTNANDMKLCVYCGFEFAGCYMHGIVVTRNGKTREMYRCDKFRQDMHSYKPTD